MLHNWAVAYLGNVIGCLGTVLLMGPRNDLGALGDGAVAATAIRR